MSDFYQWQPLQAPAWLAGEAGEGWQLAEGHLKDAATEAAKEAVKARFASTGAPDALQVQASERDDERYPGEALEAFRMRLAEAMPRAVARGTVGGLIEAAEAAAGVLSVDYLEARTVEPSSPLWARWWVLARVTWPLAPVFDESGLLWDGGWAWDFDALAEAGFLLRQLRRYRAGHCKGHLAIATADAPIFDAPGFVWDGGWSWDGGHAVTVEV